MTRQSRWPRWARLFALTCCTLHVSCVQAVFREAQFGALDGVNGFFADGIAAVLVSVVPFLTPV